MLGLLLDNVVARVRSFLIGVEVNAPGQYRDHLVRFDKEVRRETCRTRQHCADEAAVVPEVKGFAQGDLHRLLLRHHGR